MTRHPIPHHFDGRNSTGAPASQGRAKRARVAGRLDGPLSSAGYTRKTKVDFERIRSLVPLASILARYGILSELKRAGVQHRGCCPIHGGSNPQQFLVNFSSNTWHCFGDCNRGGGTLELVAARERVPVHHAAQLIAEWFALGNIPFPPTAATSRRRTVMTQRPSHRAYVIEDRDGDQNEQSGFWTKVGSAWPHKDGKGLNIQLIPGIAISGRLVLREHTEDDAKADEAKRKVGKK